jgi:bifunctional NMN adenylyltransferase/nudix hydrolase
MASNKTHRIAVYIGRFQPFHRGHEYVLKHCLENYDDTVVLFGSAHKARDTENPFTYDERLGIVDAWMEATHPGRKYWARPLRDHPYNDAQWIKSVQEHVAAVTKIIARSHAPAFDRENKPEVEITIVGSDRDASTWYLKAFPQWKLDIIEPYRNIPGLAATQLRKRYFEGTPAGPWEGLVPATLDFLASFANKPPFERLRGQAAFLKGYKEKYGDGPFVTADACVIQSGHILLVERGPEYGGGLLAMPGGFVKPHQRIKEAAVAECMEETGILLATGKRDYEITRQMLLGSIKAERQFDHPKRSLRGRIFTTCYLMRLDDTKPLPRVNGQFVPEGEEGGGVIVETSDAKWWPIAEVLDQPYLWFEDHHAIAETMISLIKD